VTLFEVLETTGAGRALFWSDPESGLRAVAVIDDLRLGPAAGGIRTRGYPSVAAAVHDAAALARAMTLKCALGGINAGGAKIVVLDHGGLDRPRAFVRLGGFIEELAGLIRTAGDLGTTAADLAAAASRTRYVHCDEGDLSASLARGLLRCVEACVQHRGHRGQLSVAIQGAGQIGAAVARALHAAGVRVAVADVDRARAERLVDALGDGARVVGADAVLAAEVDVVAPCAVGGVLDAATIESLRAWAVVPGANNVLSSPALARRMRERKILFVPDVVSSAGAVIEGVGRTVMGLADRTPLIDRLGELSTTILRHAAEAGCTPLDIAVSIAHERLEKARSWGAAPESRDDREISGAERRPRPR
jgi:leucine dehydrogenase